jgi:hypothetical protein
MLFCCHKYLPLIAEGWHDVFLRPVIHIIIIIIIIVSFMQGIRTHIPKTNYYYYYIIVVIIIIIIIMSRIRLSLDLVSSSVYCWIQLSPPFGLKAQYWFRQNYLFLSQYMTPKLNNIILYEITLNVLSNGLVNFGFSVNHLSLRPVVL